MRAAKCLLCVVLFISGQCLQASVAPAATWRQSADENTRCGCLIVGLQGKTNVTPKNSSKAIPATPNMAVFTGDLLDVLKTSRIRLICGETSTQHEWTAGSYAVPCGQANRGPLWINGRVVDPAGTRGNFPMLLSPRKTTLLDPHPKIRWTSVTGASNYTVRVRGSNLDWHTNVNSNEVAYPNDAPPLVAGQSYSISIYAGRLKSDEDMSGLEFTIIEADKAATVRARGREIQSLNVDETSKRLLRAYLYAGHNLNAEALMQLDEASDDPETVRTLAELYLKIMLIDRAEAQYLRLLNLAGENILVKAMANDRLGQIYKALSKKDQAMQKYQNALKLYVDLEDWNKVRDFAIRLSELQEL